jgi:uncharacterized Zn finger protein
MGRPWRPWEGTGRSAPAARRTPANGLRARSRRGPIGTTWWGRRWIEGLRAFGWENRLERGRTYARAGQVMGFRIASGQIVAKVQGSRPDPYRVRIAVRPIPDRGWTAATRALARRPGLVGLLLTGEMPSSVEEAFAASQVPLFPSTDRDFQTDCSCPDWANPCKHVSAVHFLVGEALDRDPFLLFELRGRPKERFLSDLRSAKPPGGDRPAPPVAAPVFEPPAAPKLPAKASVFWQTAAWPSTSIAIVGPSVPRAPLVRFGEPPFLRGDPSALERLTRAYDLLGQRALSQVARPGFPQAPSAGSGTSPGARHPKVRAVRRVSKD